MLISTPILLPLIFISQCFSIGCVSSSASLSNNGLVLSSAAAAAVEPCPRGWVYNSHLDQCYLVADENNLLSWGAARWHCANVTGGLLTSVNSQEEYHFLLELAQKAHPLYPVWIGLQHSRYSSRERPLFVWQNGRYPRFNKFLAAEPAEYEGCIAWKTSTGGGGGTGKGGTGMEDSSNDGWKSLNCEYEQPFVCKQRAANCPSATYTTLTGTLSSSNYPGDYENNLLCHYHIRVPEDYTIRLTITDFETENLFDTLSIFDGDEAVSDRIASLSGHMYSLSKTQFDSSENAMTLVFKTDFAYTRRGWSAKYEAVLGHHNVILKTPTGTLSSPNYPEDYPNNFNQVYKIAPGVPYTRIRISIKEDFRTERIFDYLKIVDGPSMDSREPPLALLNGTIPSLPWTVTSRRSNQVALRFFTDPLINFKGFRLQWETIPAEDEEN